MNKGRCPSTNHPRPTLLPGISIRPAIGALCIRLPASRTDVSLQPFPAASHFVRKERPGTNPNLHDLRRLPDLNWCPMVARLTRRVPVVLGLPFRRGAGARAVRPLVAYIALTTHGSGFDI